MYDFEKMERERALKRAVVEIVEKANSKDNEGEYVHPIMRETNPMILTFFHAADALLEVLQNRPVLFLNLLQTNKTLSAFWKQYEANIWILLLDRLVEMHMSTYMSEIYPFFVIQNYRLSKHLNRNGGESNIKDRVLLNLNHYNGPPLITDVISVSIYPFDTLNYFIVYYDTLTRLFIELLQHLEFNFSSYSIMNVNTILRRYLGLPYLTRPVICLADCFLIDKTSINKEGDVVFIYNIDVIMRTLTDLAPTSNLTKLIDTIWSYLDQQSLFPIDYAKPLRLDKSIAKPYRDLLFDPEQGLYNTPEKQRSFFLTTLGSTTSTPEEIIEKYGQALECAFCLKSTRSVDEVLLAPFCSVACHTQYTK